MCVDGGVDSLLVGCVWLIETIVFWFVACKGGVGVEAGMMVDLGDDLAMIQICWQAAKFDSE